MFRNVTNKVVTLPDGTVDRSAMQSAPLENINAQSNQEAENEEENEADEARENTDANTTTPQVEEMVFGMFKFEISAAGVIFLCCSI